MRDRLIELISKKQCRNSECVKSCSDCASIAIFDEDVEILADYLLENGVIVPPCKVGDKVYVIEDWVYSKFLEEKEVGAISIQGTNDFSKELWEDCRGGLIGAFADFGKTVFLTREEAEKALKGVKE